MTKRVILLVLTSLLAGACRCGEEPTPTSSAPPSSAPPSSAPPSSAPATATAAVATHTPPTAEQRHHVAELLRTGRTAEQNGDHAAAQAAFDEAVQLVPHDPRLLCEAGFVAHRAGHTALAAQRIDTAIAAFGPPSSVSGAGRDHLAMCLYNRGLVDEALGDPAQAVVHYNESLALRPNAVAQQHRDQAAASPQAAHVSDTIDGLPAELRDGGLFVQTTDRARLEQAMRMAFSGDDGYGYAVEPHDVSLDVLVEIPGTGDAPRPTIIYATHGVMDHAVVALPADGGWFLVIVDEGGNGEHGGQNWSFELASAQHSMLGDYLRVDVRGTRGDHATGMPDLPTGFTADNCYEDIDRSYGFVSTAICRTGARPGCFVVTETHTDANDEDLLYQCTNASGESIDYPGGNDQTLHHDAIDRPITLAPDGRFSIASYGTDPPPPPATFDAIVAQGAASGMTDREHIVVDDGDVVGNGE
jgi:tetratricopeptide (TPR) repeat protein